MSSSPAMRWNAVTRTIHARMREYLYTLKHMEELETSIIPIGDGAAISVKIEIEKERVGK